MRRASAPPRSTARAPTARQVLSDFEADKYNVLCNSMLLTEGWDCPSVDCVVVLRPTKVRSLYSQMVGRGTRLSPGKTDLLLLDFLWMTDKHELCRPADLVCEDRAVARQMTENLAESGCPQDIEEAAAQASEDVVAQREEALAKQLEEQRRKKAKLVDPLQYEMSIQAEDLAGYVPAFGWEAGPPSAEAGCRTGKAGHPAGRRGIGRQSLPSAGPAAQAPGRRLDHPKADPLLGKIRLPARGHMELRGSQAHDRPHCGAAAGAACPRALTPRPTLRLQNRPHRR